MKQDLLYVLNLFVYLLLALSCIIVGFAILITLVLICVNVSAVTVGTVSDFIVRILF